MIFETLTLTENGQRPSLVFSFGIFWSFGLDKNMALTYMRAECTFLHGLSLGPYRESYETLKILSYDSIRHGSVG